MKVDKIILEHNRKLMLADLGPLIESVKRLIKIINAAGSDTKNEKILTNLTIMLSSLEDIKPVIETTKNQIKLSRAGDFLFRCFQMSMINEQLIKQNLMQNKANQVLPPKTIEVYDNFMSKMRN